MYAWEFGFDQDTHAEYSKFILLCIPVSAILTFKYDAPETVSPIMLMVGDTRGPWCPNTRAPDTSGSPTVTLYYC